MDVIKGSTYRHFKGDLIRVLEIGKHTETEEMMIVYEHCGVIWVRPYSMFVSKVDKKKYPTVEQEYRFELVE